MVKKTKRIISVYDMGDMGNRSHNPRKHTNKIKKIKKTYSCSSIIHNWSPRVVENVSF